MEADIGSVITSFVLAGVVVGFISSLLEPSEKDGQNA